jgi:hypothetical protein
MKSFKNPGLKLKTPGFNPGHYAEYNHSKTSVETQKPRVENRGND